MENVSSNLIQKIPFMPNRNRASRTCCASEKGIAPKLSIADIFETRG
jgi:hypothetical protein